MENFAKHLIYSDTCIGEALERLDKLAPSANLFVLNSSDCLVGSVTDGDIRRGLIGGASLSDILEMVMNKEPKVMFYDSISVDQIAAHRIDGISLIPVITDKRTVVDILDLSKLKSLLPVDVVIMAGGKGTRLLPLTIDLPKPLLKVGEKPIIEHNIDRLIQFGISNYWISINYLGDKIQSYLRDGRGKSITINYVNEDQPLGTIGAVSKIEEFKNEIVLLTNSDILTNIDYEDFYRYFIEKNADFCVVSIPYDVEIPYAVLEQSENRIIGFKEKPTYTYYSNGGIYMMKKSVLKYLPKDAYFNTTDLMQLLINKGYNVMSYALIGYWLDIGKHEDYKKAQEDISKVSFE